MTQRDREFERVAIVNRGEPAMRLILAVREYNYEHDLKIRTIALHTEPDRQAMFVREADEAYSLGPAMFDDPRDGKTKIRYLDHAGLEQALVATRADAAWVGWGFVAEHAGFVELCQRLGVVFIGPGADVMRRLGDKITAKRLAEEAGVAVAPWSGGPVASAAEATRHGEALGFPLMIKATAGGGGRGIRKVSAAGELAGAFDRASAEALQSFGDATVFMERMVSGARHVEVQIIADGHGVVWALGVRDCTIQRRNQKVLEETPSPALTPAQDDELRQAAAQLCRGVSYENAGTVEFLYDPAAEAFSFMEVNPRLQVEHPVTEMVTGADLVKLQLHVARGGRLQGEPPVARGHAVEVRLNAEDPDNDFAPAPGVIERLRLPVGPWIRIDTGVEEGDEVPPQFDSMIAKIIAWGRDRDEAMARLRRALADGAVVIRGGASNKGFLLQLLGRGEVKRSEVHVGWLDQQMASGQRAPSPLAGVALVQAAIDTYEAEMAHERAQFFVAAARGRPWVSDEVGRTIELGYQGQTYELTVKQRGARQYRIFVDGLRLEASVEDLGRAGRRLSCGGQRHRVLALTHGVTYLVDVDGVPHRISRDRAGVVRVLSPAVVVSVAVQEGDEVEVGDRLAVVEAMKTEMEIVARFAGRVRKVMVINNIQVGPGDPLMLIEPPEEERVAAGTGQVRFDDLELPAADDSRHMLDDLRCLVLGYCTDASELNAMLSRRGTLSAEAAPDDEELLRAEDEILGTFVDICSLFHQQPGIYYKERKLDRLSAEEYLFTFLRDPGARGEGLPPTFLEALRRALAHYGVASLERTPKLEDSLFRLYKSYNRIDDQLAPILSVLQRRLEQITTLAPRISETFKVVLERMIVLSRGRFPGINDLAREVHYRYFHRTVLERVRRRAFSEADDDLRALDGGISAEERGDRKSSLVRCPHPLKSFLSRRMSGSAESLQEVILEVMIRRYYWLQPLANLRLARHQGRLFGLADLSSEGHEISLIATHLTRDQMPRVVTMLPSLISEAPCKGAVALDLYVWCPEPIGPDGVLDLTGVLNEVELPEQVQRVVVAISSPGSAEERVFHVTFRPGPRGFAEDRLFRGIHPMMAKRLDLWRLSNFEIERLPSADEIYLFRMVGRDNPSDQRLIALAEVRDLTPVRDTAGNVVGLPVLERALIESVASIRMYQSRRPPRQRLHWNRVSLFVYPPVTLRPEEMKPIMRRLAPTTAGQGLERVLISARVPLSTGELKDTVIDISGRSAGGLSLRFRDPPTRPMEPLSKYIQKVVRLRQRGMIYPYELISELVPDRDEVQADFPPGFFTEYDLVAEDDNALAPVQRPWGQNTANVVVGLICNYTDKHPEGMERVILLGDPSRSMGSLAEPECRRIVGAIGLARSRGLPLEWFSLSAGALISMESGTENMDWIALVLRHLVNFTQGGGEVNLIVNGINVGAQPYWNAEATMLMHTRGVLIMTPDGAMVLTGKKALDYSGGVSAENNQGIGGYERIMGPNGQAQYFAHNIHEACQILFRYYGHTYRKPGERFPRRAKTRDPRERDVSSFLHGSSDESSFKTIGEVFSPDKNPGRKKPFEIRKVMRATVDQDLHPLERWFGWRNAETVAVWDAHLDGYPVCLIGLESRPLPRPGLIPADGPEQWSAGTLFPLSSKKMARAINAASDNRPVVILANLSGFDGSPESMRNLQLEFGAEIGRAVVNFDGPMVFCVISRYHGGAFVVFSNRLNNNLEVAALEGSYASVIGGAPAAAVVFAREVQKRTREDARITELEKATAEADGAERVRLRARLQTMTRTVHSEKLGEVATEFDGVHSIHRAKDVGSVHYIVPPARLRPYLIEAIERGRRRVLAAPPVPVPEPAA